jgi:hypothetical protein
MQKWANRVLFCFLRGRPHTKSFPGIEWQRMDLIYLVETNSSGDKKCVGCPFVIMASHYLT